MKPTYKLLRDRFAHARGTVVYQARVHDFGLARDDTMATDSEHISVTTMPDGGYPVFTVPTIDLEPVA